MVAAIYISLAFASFLTWLGFDREDSWMVIFSGMIFVFSGLNILLFGFQDLDSLYSQVLGIIIIFIGSYLSVRSTVEFIKDNL